MKPPGRPAPPTKRRLFFIAAMLAAALLLTGCKDVNDINQRTLASGLGIDVGQSEGEIELTVVFFSNEVAGKGGDGGMGGMGDGGEAAPMQKVVISAQGQSFNTALLNVAAQAPGQVFLGSTTLLVIGSALAQQGMGQALDFLLRHPHFSAHVKTVIADGRAGDLLDIPTEAAPSPGVHLFKALRSGTREDATLRAVPLHRLFNLTFTPWAFDWTALVAPGAIGPVAGTGALIRGERMIRTLNSEELHFIAAINKTVATHIVIPPLPGRDAPLAARFRSVSIRPKPFQPDQTAVDIVIKGQAYLSEGRGITFVGGEGDEVRRHIESYLANELERILKELYGEGLDVLDLAEQVRAKDASGMVPSDWLERLPLFTFNVETKINFLGGLRSL